MSKMSKSTTMIEVKIQNKCLKSVQSCPDSSMKDFELQGRNIF